MAIGFLHSQRDSFYTIEETCAVFKNREEMLVSCFSHQTFNYVRFGSFRVSQLYNKHFTMQTVSVTRIPITKHIMDSNAKLSC